MGVFARLLGRSKATPETSTTAVSAGTKPEETEAEAELVEAREAGSAEAKDGSGVGHEDVAVRSDSGTDDASEGAGIPRQQAAGEAADSEAGEDARR
ncbi:hypothetical protein [Streptomyces flaveolus]|uniref:hypothetical protein n=1 Tax=Streptomyces flaveolus TaxID=67297 RepID=UPI003403A72B